MALEGPKNDVTAELMNALEKLEPDFKDRQEDLEFLKTFLSSNDCKTLMKAHSLLKIVETPSTEQSALTLSHMVSYDIEANNAPLCQELYDLISSTHVNTLLVAYDRVVNKEYPLQSIQPEEIMQETIRDVTQVVRIHKGPRQRLGATVKADNVGNILIGRILHGTVADRCGLLHPGDVLHEINKTDLQGMTIDEVGDLMKNLEGAVEMKISPSVEHSLLPLRRHQEVKHMKALFSYDPTGDQLLPCEEAGLAFNERDVLSVFNQEDPEWWQARLEGDTRVGLIPSAKMRERLYYKEATSNTKSTSRFKGKNKKSTEFYDPSNYEELGGTEVTSYEEVVRINPQLHRLQPRPLVLIAPKCPPYSMSEVQSKLIGNHRNFGVAAPYTSRQPRTGEVQGQHFYFTSREDMRHKISSNQFIEHLEIGGHYYGLSINTVRSIANQAKTALITVAPRALKFIRKSAELKAHVVFFTLPSEANIQRYWVDTGVVQERDISQIRQATDKMMSLYGQYFDSVVPYCNSDGVVIDVQRIVNQLLDQPQWVPAHWVA